MTPNPNSTAYTINPSHQPVCLYVYITIVARQWLGYCGNEYTCNNRRIVGGVVFYLVVSYQRKVGDWFFPELLVNLHPNLKYCYEIYNEITHRRYES
jgi:hypothetical protein